MNRTGKLLIMIVFLVFTASAQTIFFEGNGDTLTTGDLIDETGHIPFTTGVVEIANLEITVRSGSTDQHINSNTDSLGVKRLGISDASARFEMGESMFISFNKDVQITQFDFNHFDNHEVFRIQIGNDQEFDIPFANLSDRRSLFFNTNMVVYKETQIEFSAAVTTNGIGLDSISLNPLEDVGLSLAPSNGMIVVSARLVGSGNHVLECTKNLISADWNIISSSFSEDSDWMFPITNTGFFRTVTASE